MLERGQGWLGVMEPIGFCTAVKGRGSSPAGPSK